MQAQQNNWENISKHSHPCLHGILRGLNLLLSGFPSLPVETEILPTSLQPPSHTLVFSCVDSQSLFAFMSLC